MLLERGEEAHLRQQKVEAFWKNGLLDPDSNVQFGEGGAGTFSDGKLNTLVKDTFGRNQEVLKRFVEAGAGEEILYQQKPHLGTDMLVGIVENLRNQIQEMGGTVRFNAKVTDLIFEQDKLQAVKVNDQEVIPAQICVFQCAADTEIVWDVFKRSLHGIQILCCRTSDPASPVYDQSGSLWGSRESYTWVCQL